MFTKENSIVLKDSNGLKEIEESIGERPIFIQNSCLGTLCDFKNLKKFYKQHDQFSLVYLRDSFLPASNLGASFIVKRSGSTRSFLGEALQLSSSGQPYFAMEVCHHTSDTRSCLEDVAIAQYAPGIIMPL